MIGSVLVIIVIKSVISVLFSPWPQKCFKIGNFLLAWWKDFPLILWFLKIIDCIYNFLRFSLWPKIRSILVDHLWVLKRKWIPCYWSQCIFIMNSLLIILFDSYAPLLFNLLDLLWVYSCHLLLSLSLNLFLLPFPAVRVSSIDILTTWYLLPKIYELRAFSYILAFSTFFQCCLPWYVFVQSCTSNFLSDFPLDISLIYNI